MVLTTLSKSYLPRDSAPEPGSVCHAMRGGLTSETRRVFRHKLCGDIAQASILENPRRTVKKSPLPSETFAVDKSALGYGLDVLRTPYQARYHEHTARRTASSIIATSCVVAAESQPDQAPAPMLIRKPEPT